MRVLGGRLKELYGGPSTWNSTHIANAGDLLGGLGIRDLQQLDPIALEKALPTVKDIKIPRDKSRLLAKKILGNLGDVQTWEVTTLKMIGPLLKDFPESKLELLQPDKALETMKILKKTDDISKSKKRVLIKQVRKRKV